MSANTQLPAGTALADRRADARDDTFGDELPPGTTLCSGQYRIGRYLNSGGFGITYLADDSLDRQVVIKECFPGAMCFRAEETVRLRSRSRVAEFDKILDLFQREARALADLRHPNIVGVHQIFEDNGTAYMVLDFIDGRDLWDVIDHERDLLRPDMVTRLLCQVLDAVAYIHDRDILHRDISPDNILMDRENRPVLIDFGAAREDATRVSRALSKVMTVKDGYSPQEFYVAGSKQGFASDLYAVAATFYHVVSGGAPPNSQKRLAAIARGEVDPLRTLGAEIPGYPAEFLDAINRCLSVQPKDRLQSAHEWRDVADVERRRKRLLEQAANDRELEQRISRMVCDHLEETTRGGAQAAPVAPPPTGESARRRAEATPASAPAAASAPVTATAASQRPDPVPRRRGTTRRVLSLLWTLVRGGRGAGRTSSEGRGPT